MNTSVSVFAKTKQRLTSIVPEIVFVLLLVQPVLDIISYWATEWEITTYTTIFRFLMFAGVLLYSFILSDRKGIYFLFGGVIALYWILHVVACLRSEGGYLSPFTDLNNLLRTVQLPLFPLPPLMNDDIRHFPENATHSAPCTKYSISKFVSTLIFLISSIVASRDKTTRENPRLSANFAPSALHTPN